MLLICVCYWVIEVYDEKFCDVGFCFEFFDVIFVCFGKYLLVNVFWIVVCGVFVVFVEFDWEIMKWVVMEFLYEVFGDKLGV